MGLWCLCLSLGLGFSNEHFVLIFQVLYLSVHMEKNEGPWTLMREKIGGIGTRRGMKNKEDEYSQWFWYFAAAAMEGLKELVFHVCDGRN